MTASTSALAAVVGSVDSTTVREDVCQRAFGSEFAISLRRFQPALDAMDQTTVMSSTFVKYLHGAESIAASVE